MATPIIYHTNLFASATLSGTLGTNANPVGRIADGSVNLAYTLTASGSSENIVGVLATAGRPDSLVITRATGTLSGTTLAVVSADVGGGNPQVEYNAALTTSTTPLVVAMAGPAARRQWQFALTSPVDTIALHELQLATKYTLPRSPQVEVTRTKVRQFTRIPVAGGQPFVKKDGPGLRRTVFTFVLVSAAEVADLEAFVDAVEGGQAFTLTDDRAETYWAELIGSDVSFQDSAGVFTVSLTFQEISAEL